LPSGRTLPEVNLNDSDADHAVSLRRSLYAPSLRGLRLSSPPQPPLCHARVVGAIVFLEACSVAPRPQHDADEIARKLRLLGCTEEHVNDASR
jgi:hypothetical protein